MKKLFAIIILGVLLSACSGVSTKDKDYMQIVLNNELRDSYSQENIPVMFVNAELKKIEKKESYLGGKYMGTFGCSFEQNGDKIYMAGAVAFDDNMEVSKMPERYGNNKIAIDISVLTINNKPIKKISENKYILNRFINRNNLQEK